jgi:hypothetical protein
MQRIREEAGKVIDPMEGCASAQTKGFEFFSDTNTLA